MGHDLADTTKPANEPLAPYFFADPVLDDLLDVCLQLAGELWVTKTRLQRLEDVLDIDGRPASEVLEEHVDWDDPAGYESERDVFVQRVFAALTRRRRISVREII